jgi:hypothetical protein
MRYFPCYARIKLLVSLTRSGCFSAVWGISELLSDSWPGQVEHGQLLIADTTREPVLFGIFNCLYIGLCSVPFLGISLAAGSELIPVEPPCFTRVFEVLGLF